MRLQGTYTALVTPFRDGAVDEDALKNLVDFQLRGGIDGIVPCGTTGEASTLSYEEHERVIALTVKWVGGKVPIIPGTGSNSTKETIELTEIAKNLGADMALVVAPYYNRPTQEGMYRHFRKVAEDVDLPLILYNIPGRTGVNMLPELVARLAQIPNIVAIKEAAGSVQQVADIFRLTKGAARLTAHGQTAEISFYRNDWEAPIGKLLKRPEAERILSSASDLTRVSVTRQDPQTGKARTWTLDCTAILNATYEPAPESFTQRNNVFSGLPGAPGFRRGPGVNNSGATAGPDFWLENGDVIEVPDRP